MLKVKRHEKNRILRARGSPASCPGFRFSLLLSFRTLPFSRLFSLTASLCQMFLKPCPGPINRCCCRCCLRQRPPASRQNRNTSPCLLPEKDRTKGKKKKDREEERKNARKEERKPARKKERKRKERKGEAKRKTQKYNEKGGSKKHGSQHNFHQTKEN